jgi:hypothetical protein
VEKTTEFIKETENKWPGDKKENQQKWDRSQRKGF